MARNEDIHPSYLGFQVDWPVFVKVPFNAGGKEWKRTEYFNWMERDFDQKQVATLYAQGFIYHNPQFEKNSSVGDRLHELNLDQMKRLVRMLNDELKGRTISKTDYNNKRCKQSQVESKQRGIIRKFLRENPWIADHFHSCRDYIIGG